MHAVLTEDGKILLPPSLRENAQLQPGDTLDVQFYKGSIVLRKHQPLTQEQCATLLERSRSQPNPAAEDDAAVDRVIRDARAGRR
jgi:bifunctional DNA-binding transcriptional regulator/antitoxin component of YhaV-PrlF toxin-antitoxin module